MNRLKLLLAVVSAIGLALGFLAPLFGMASWQSVVWGAASGAVLLFLLGEILTSLHKGEFGLDVFIDHGEFGGYLYAGLAQRMGVAAILGPRNVDAPSRAIIDWVGINPERVQGLAAGYAERGHKMIGFNTDANVIPQEELFLQSAINVKYGFDNSDMAAVRGHTIVPAITAGIQHRVGSLEHGKDADIVIVSGDPSDPRSHVEAVFIEGRKVYDPSQESRRF